MRTGTGVRHPASQPDSIPAVLRTEQSARDMWRGFGEAWTVLSTLITGIALWGGVGYAVDRWVGTWPVLFILGVFVGNFAGIYLIYIKWFKEEPPDAT